MKVIELTVEEVRFSVINKIDQDMMINNAIVNMHPLFYCADNIFSFEPFEQTDWTQHEVSKGIHHMFSLNYSHFGKFQASIKDGNNNEVPIVNLSMNKFWIDIFKEVLKNEKN